MAGLSSPGIGSGLDINGLVTKLMAVEQQPLTALATKEASYQAKLSAFGSMKGALSALQTAAKALTGASTFTGMSAGVSDTAVLSASAESTAATGTYDIAVSKLAKAHTVHTNVDYGTDTFDTGTLSIAIGSGTPAEIKLTANLTLSGIRDAINNGNAGVTAAIVNDGTADRLVLTSKTTGTAGAITITAPTTNSDGTRRLTDLIGGNLTVDQVAQNAKLTINGIEISRSSNAISDAITGVTLSLTKADVTTPATAKLTVSRNTSTVQNAVSAFVKAYNDAVAQIKSTTTYDSVNKKASVLTGDSTARSVQSQLMSLAGAAVTGVSGGISRLSDIGITVQKDGTLTVNSTKLAAALSDTSKDVATLFTSTTTDNKGIAVRFNELMASIVGSTGIISSRTDGITTSIAGIGKQRDAINLRLTKVEKRYRAQFTALDSLMASMQQTSSYLTQQLTNLPGVVSTTK